jgi:hypothetical protein
MTSPSPTSVLGKAKDKTTKTESSVHVKFTVNDPETHAIPTSMGTWDSEDPPDIPSKEAMLWSAKQMFPAEEGKVKQYDVLVQDKCEVEKNSSAHNNM